jgi:hypothetical protein
LSWLAAQSLHSNPCRIVAADNQQIKSCDLDLERFLTLQERRLLAFFPRSIFGASLLMELPKSHALDGSESSRRLA